MLTIQQACKKFNNHIVLDHIDLHIAKDSIVGLAGPSGGGKSTLLRCTQQLEHLDTGSVTHAGKSGFMFQDFQLFPHMTVLKNLIYAPRLHAKLTDHQTQAHTLLEQLGIADKMHAYPHQLSGGQKQRVALARSLMMQPSLLLCDEPTSGLDLATIDDVVALLQSIQKMGVTMMIASHDLDFLTKLADRIVVLKQGKIVADVNPQSPQHSVATLKQYY